MTNSEFPSHNLLENFALQFIIEDSKFFGLLIKEK